MGVAALGQTTAQGATHLGEVAGPDVDHGVAPADPDGGAVDEPQVATVGGDLHLGQRVLEQPVGAEAVGDELDGADPVAALVEHPGDLEDALGRDQRAWRLELDLEAEAARELLLDPLGEVDERLDLGDARDRADGHDEAGRHLADALEEAAQRADRAGPGLAAQRGDPDAGVVGQVAARGGRRPRDGCAVDDAVAGPRGEVEPEVLHGLVLELLEDLRHQGVVAVEALQELLGVLEDQGLGLTADVAHVVGVEVACHDVPGVDRTTLRDAEMGGRRRLLDVGEELLHLGGEPVQIHGSTG